MHDPVTSKGEANHRFLCENCGANMIFDAAYGKLACTYCGHQKIVQSDGFVDERSFDDFIARGMENPQPIAKNALQVSCSSCGATITFTPPNTATSCDFCGGKIVAQPKAADPIIAPEGVLPFVVSHERVASEFAEWVASLWFAPFTLKKIAKTEDLSSIYIPYWTFDAASRTEYTGQRGTYYYVSETYTEDGETKTRRVRHTRWEPVSGQVSRQFDDVCVPATTSLPERYIKKLEPWDLDRLRSYEPAFLSGHKAQTYQVSLNNGYEKFQDIAAGVIDHDIRDDIGGDEQSVGSADTDFSNRTFKHILLPIYAGAYRFRGSVYQIVVNGRTGEVQGERPYSLTKIALTIFAIFVLVLVIGTLIGIFK